MLAACAQSTPLVPVFGGHELVGDADADDGTDQGVGTRGRQPEPPGAEIPDNCGDQECEDHGEAGPGADLQDQFDRQQGDDAERDCAARRHYAEKVPEPGPHDRDVGFE